MRRWAIWSSRSGIVAAIPYDDLRTLLRVAGPTQLLGGVRVIPGGTLAPPDSIAPARVSDSTPRFRIVRSGSVPILEGPIDPAA